MTRLRIASGGRPSMICALLAPAGRSRMNSASGFAEALRRCSNVEQIEGV